MKTLLFLLLLPVLTLAADKKLSKGPQPTDYYTIDKLMMPLGVGPEIGGLDAFPDGRLAACFHHGEVGIYQPKDKSWKIFAEGLHEPLGVLIEDEKHLLVMQRPELTRLTDDDGDGVADRYETVWDGFGLSGNYHEFAFGPVKAPDGKLFVALNLASQGDTVFKEVRGEFSPVGIARDQFYTGNWKKDGKDAGRMYSRVPYRGWIVQIDAKSGEATPWACGFRSPDGLGFDGEGRLLVDDNQGDWRGSSELFVVKRDGFYGHPASLVWRKDWDGRVPLQVPEENLNKLRTPAAVWFPHGIFANSPTQILTLPKTKAWGALGGQVIVGEMNSAKILRTMLEEVGGIWQGALVTFIKDDALKSGVHRMVFSGDKLFIGHTHLSWAGGEGITGVVPKAKAPFEVLDMKITPKGFRFTFTEPLDEASAIQELWEATRYTYAYHSAYGSPQLEKAEVDVTSVTFSNNDRTAEVEVNELKPDLVYDFDLSKLKSGQGSVLLNSRIAYTVRRVPK